MKKRSNYLVFIVLLLAGSQIFGQGQYQITPSNAITQAQQIYVDYSTVVTTPYTNLESYIVNLSQPLTYDALVSNGTLEVSSMNLDNISVNWQSQLGAVSYGISYFNLGTGDNNVTSAPNTAADVTLSNLDDGWYILAITSYYREPGGQIVSSFGDIIIIEKKVYIHLGTSGELCDCDAEEIIFHASPQGLSNGLSQVAFEWNPQAYIDYVMKIEYVGGYSTSYINLTPDLNYGGYPQWLININCLGNVWDTDAANTLIGYSISEPLYITVDPGNYNWELEHEAEIMSSVTFKPCLAKQGGGLGGEKREIKLTDADAKSPVISPNPTKEILNIYLEGKSQDSNITMTIYDQAGRIIATHNTTLESSQIDVSNFAAGTYFIKIKTDQKSYVERFIKID